METIYLTPHGKHSLYPFEGNTPVQAEFIQSVMTGDYNVKSYSARKLKTNTVSTEQVYFIPTPGKEKSIEIELRRGRKFFTGKGGLLFGAYHELTKLGTFVKIPT